MRDFFSVLLQVSFAAKSCEDDLQACLEYWMPLLRAVKQKSSKSVSSVISEVLIRGLQNMDDLEFSEEELDAMGLPSKNDEMGSSLIESKLDDHTLAHCFSFLSVKDVCTGIERCSHRFLQVSRNAHFSFFQERAKWNSERLKPIDYGRWYYPLDRLLHSHPNIPDSIALRNLHRFKIGRLKYDPIRSVNDSRSHHTLKFQDVIRVIGRNVHSLDLKVQSDYDVTEQPCFPEELSHITQVKFKDCFWDHFEKVCLAFPKCRELDISSECSTLKPLNQLSELESLTINTSDLSEESMNDLDPACLPNLKSLEIRTEDLSHFTPLLNAQVEYLKLDVLEISEGITIRANLTSLRRLNVIRLRRPSVSKMMISQLGLPEKIPSVRLDYTEWNVLVDWVGRVQELECILCRGYGGTDPINDALKTEMLANWELDRFLLKLENPVGADIEMICSLMKHPNTQRSQIVVDLNKVNRDDERFESMVDQVESVAINKRNCIVEVTRREHSTETIVWNGNQDSSDSLS